MLLYRYFATHVLDTLRYKRLKVARISGLNDPFECRFVAAGEITREEIRDMKANKAKAEARRLRAQGVSEAKVKRAVRKIQHMNIDIRGALERSKKDIISYQEEILEESARVLCFSALAPELHDEILMWSHYTNGHRGGRIGFEIPEELAQRMRYSEKRVVVDLTDLGRPGGDEVIRRALLESNRRKSKRWSYEDEYRLFIDAGFCQKEEGLEFWPFDPSWVKRVDLGLRFPPQEKEAVLALLGSTYPSVECYQANFHPTDYALVYSSVVDAR